MELKIPSFSTRNHQLLQYIAWWRICRQTSCHGENRALSFFGLWGAFLGGAPRGLSRTSVVNYSCTKKAIGIAALDRPLLPARFRVQCKPLLLSSLSGQNGFCRVEELVDLRLLPDERR